MSQLRPETLKAVDVATDHFIKASTLDMEILSDDLKYSLWLSTLAAAGTAFVLSQSSQPLALPLSYKAAGFTFAASILLGGLVIIGVNRNLADKRALITLFGKQRALAFCGQSVDPGGTDIYTFVMEGHFLQASERSFIEKVFFKWQSRLHVFVWPQSLLVALAYLSVLTRLL